MAIKYSAYCLLTSLLFSVTAAQASHIIGGELSYQCLGDDNYLITLKVYRDCYNGQAPFDNPANIFVYTGLTSSYVVLPISFSASDTIVNSLFGPCTGAYAVCEEVAVYSDTINLPPNPDGYVIIYQRCCRSLLDVNISEPSNTGSTFTAFIPSSNLVNCNSSPYFNNDPPGIVCFNQSISVDFSATDPDGDSLVYSLCAPYTGANSVDPEPYPPYLDYTEVNYVDPYSSQNPIGGNPQLSIDPSTGMITGVPDAIGTYVVGVCVQEYRNGVFLSQHRGDYIFNVAECGDLANASLPEDYFSCDDLTVDFVNSSYGNVFHWDFGVPGISSDTSNIAQPTFTYPDTGIYIAALIAYSSDSCVDTAYTTVHVYPSTITVDFSPLAGEVGQQIHFMDLSTTNLGIVHSWWWSFGDGFHSGFQNPIHTYQNAGTYQVTLLASNSFGCSNDTIKTVIIESATGVGDPFFNYENGIKNIVLINMLGQVQPVTNIQLIGSNYQFDQTKLPSGVYLLKVFSSAGVATKKIVVQH